MLMVVLLELQGLLYMSIPHGKTLLVNWHVGYKLVYESFTNTLTSRLKKERRKKWDERNQEEIAKAVKDLDDFNQKHTKVEDPNLKRVREDLQNRIGFLKKHAESYDDKGPVMDAVVWHDGELWRVALDTQSLEDEPNCGKLADFIPLTNYKTERKYGIFSKLDGPLFRIPITITKPAAVVKRPPVVSFLKMKFKPGQIERRFIEVPLAASWVEATMQTTGFDTTRRFFVDTVQLCPLQRPMK